MFANLVLIGDPNVPQNTQTLNSETLPFYYKLVNNDSTSKIVCYNKICVIVYKFLTNEDDFKCCTH